MKDLLEEEFKQEVATLLGIEIKEVTPDLKVGQFYDHLATWLLLKTNKGFVANNRLDCTVVDLWSQV